MADSATAVIPTLSAEKQERFDALCRLLLERNRSLNLTALNTAGAVRSRHFEDSLAALPVMDRLAEGLRKKAESESIRVIDVGSGAGFPALALAIARPEWRFTSLEATAKKVRFQQDAIDLLGLENVTALQGRAESLGRVLAHRERYDFATARALAHLNTLAELTLPFVRPGGCVLAWKGARAEDEIAGAKRAIETLGGMLENRLPYAIPATPNGAPTESVTDRLQLVVMRKVLPTSARYPRRPGLPKKKPLV